MTTVNVNNINKPSPKWWKRLESGLLIGLVPTYTGFITATPIEDSMKVWALAGAGLFTGLVKTIGIFLGENDSDANNV